MKNLFLIFFCYSIRIGLYHNKTHDRKLLIKHKTKNFWIALNLENFSLDFAIWKGTHHTFRHNPIRTSCSDKRRSK